MSMKQNKVQNCPAHLICFVGAGFEVLSVVSNTKDSVEVIITLGQSWYSICVGMWNFPC